MIMLTTNNLLLMNEKVSSYLDQKWGVGVNPWRERIIVLEKMPGITMPDFNVLFN